MSNPIKEKPAKHHCCFLCGEAVTGTIHITPEGAAHWHCLMSRQQARQNQIVPLDQP